MFRYTPFILAACLTSTAGVGAASAVARPSAAPASADHTGIQWEPTFAAACARANRENKPVLVLHLFGKLNEEFC